MAENHLETLFVQLQNRLGQRLGSDRVVFRHPTAKGDASEGSWRTMLGEHLPNRYQVDKAFVIAANGNQSDQIDLLIYDGQYTPLFYKTEDQNDQNNQRYVPAESVYAAFEVKPNLNRAHIQYAGAKIASVRKLDRTSADIIHAGGTHPKRTLFRILGGILCFESSWNPSFGIKLEEALESLAEDERLDLGCAVTGGAFDVTYSDSDIELQPRGPEKALVYFLLRLLGRLQSLGTAPAIDYDVYARALGI